MWVVAFAGWTLFVWAVRVKNASGDAAAIVLAATFLVPAALLLVPRLRTPRFVTGLGLWTAIVWVTRVVPIVAGDRSAAFKVVHVALGAISIALAASAQRHVQRQRQAPAPASGLEEFADG